MGLPDQFVELRLKGQCAVDLFALTFKLRVSYLLLLLAVMTCNTLKEVFLKIKPLKLRTR